MKIRLNENEKVVKMVKEGLKKKNGLGKVKRQRFFF